MPRYLDHKGKVIKERRAKMGDGGAGAGVGDTGEMGSPVGTAPSLGESLGAMGISTEGISEGALGSIGGVGGPSPGEGAPGAGAGPRIVPVIEAPKEGKKPEEVSSRAWEEERAKAETQKKRKRRRSLLTEEEGGLLRAAPSYRRSILGG